VEGNIGFWVSYDEPFVERFGQPGAVLLEVLDRYTGLARVVARNRQNRLTVDKLSQRILNVDNNDLPVSSLFL
jgi:hypothetical protein